MPAVRTDRCPHCWASLPEAVGPHCIHCGRSLAPTGRKARRTAERSATGPGMASPPASSPPPATYEPVQTHQPVRTYQSPEMTQPPVVTTYDSAEQGYQSSVETGWAPPGETGAFAPPPPPPPARGHRLRTLLAVGGAILGFIAASATINALTGWSAGPFTERADNLAEDGQAPRVYEGPTFTVRLPGSPSVDVVSEDGMSFTIYGVEFGDRATMVGVMELPPDVGFDAQAGAQGAAERIGGTVASVTAFDFGGLPAADFRIENAQGGQATAWGRMIVTETKLYQIVTVQEGDLTEPPADHITALETFALR